MTAIIITLVSTVAIGASLLLNNLNHEILFEINENSQQQNEIIISIDSDNEIESKTMIDEIVLRHVEEKKEI
ncbi:MAG: hypothetical protein HN729_02545 [Candidatus Marinimicrobia bacterium]|jgi:MinD superfamily P-loop ATPase|nr:hypothetical protein [Candidatus Neomarinimicrobiota bacterium]MBT3632862.1 hypothetical protein [Candidatus Neomarinimicrobiota bacterium]MBT3681972.1 hypothetical protein [Candidatus Neomarinimicrobiota bacterium]MBT3758999.1 hypothetical protein [Candidatus Neomarinimicrobiota bacterium]MBT3895102.1 hypothetical protein [Candidatus Neomarinimicrobiota bacterium]